MFIKMEKNYTFTSQNESFLDLAIIIYTPIILSPCFIAIYRYIHPVSSRPHILLLLVLLAAWSLPIGYSFKHLYYRWLMFQFDKESILSINTEHKTITYKHKGRGTIEEAVTFTPDDIEKWWKFDAGYMSMYVSAIEFRLKNGKRVVISSGLQKAIDFIYDNRNELGLPEEYVAEGQSGRSRSFKAYIEKLEQLV